MAPTGPAVAPALAERLWPLHPVVVLLCLLPFQWIDVAQAGGMGVQLPYMGVLLAAGAALAWPPAFRAGVGFLRHAALWLVPYLAYALIAWLVFRGTDMSSSPLRQVFFVLGGCAVAAWLLAARDLPRLLRRAGAAGLIAFVAGTEVIARGIGLSWVEAAQAFFLAGDLDFVVYDFLRGIFNANNPDPEELIQASLKNSIAGALLLALCLFRIGRAPEAPDRAGQAVTVAVLGLLLMINTRSVLVTFCLGLVLLAAIVSLRRRRRSVVGAVTTGAAAVAGVALLSALLSADSAFNDLLGARFAFGDDSTASRFVQYAWALERIEEAGLMGSGYAEIDGHPVHNLFLGALMHAGLPAFALVVAAYLVLLSLWVAFVLRIVLKPDSWRLALRPEWVAMLPIVPLARVWVSGDAGQPPLEAWLAITIFAAILAAEARAARPAVPHRPAVQISRPLARPAATRERG